MVSLDFSQLRERIHDLITFYGSQRKLADSLGINQSQISRYLSGARNPSSITKSIINKRFNYQERAVEKVKKIIRKPSHKKKVGKHVDKRKFVRFEFSLWRRNISDTTQIPTLLKKFKRLYHSVSKEARHIKAQRLGVAISTSDRETEMKEYYSSKAKRKYSRKKEELDFITTIIYARNLKSTKLMFQEIEEKIRGYLMKTAVSPTLHEDKDDREAKVFYVFFEDETVMY